MKPALRGLWPLALAAGLVAMGVDLARAQTAATAPTADAPPARAAAALYREHCAACHGEQRLGGMGPALLPQSLERLKPAEARQVITRGRAATQMPAFAEKLSADEVQALADWIYAPVSPAPTWSEADIRASRTEAPDARKLPGKPLWKADPMNLFVVVEGGDHHVSLVDGDRFEVIHRFASRFALHGGPKFSPDGRFVYFGSRDGWITKYDLWNLRVVAEVRAGLNMRNVAVSGDGQWVMAANYLPHTLALFDAQLNLVKTYAAATLDGKASSRVSAVYDAAPRKSFVIALKDIAELWEISYDPAAEPIHDGYVHDYKMGEAIAKPGTFNIRRTQLDEPLDDFFFDQGYAHALGATRPRTAAPGDAQARTEAAPTAQVVNLDIRKKIADLPIAGMPHLGSGITFAWNGSTVLASPNLQGGAIDVIDMKTWRPLQRIATPGPGFFMRSHEATPYAWTDSMMSPGARDTLTLIDKRTLKVAAQIREPGRTLAHTEFTKDGRFALVSVWEMDGALIVYDAQTLKEVKRLPMSKPVGKYNVWNKITRSEGTSH
jgi:mono/diheme cytochrome c family protein